MSTRETKTFSFTPQQAMFVRACVASGQYQSASEVVRLRLLADEEAKRKSAVARVQAMIEQGAAELDRGEAVSGDAYFAEWDAKIERRRRDAGERGAAG